MFIIALLLFLFFQGTIAGCSPSCDSNPLNCGGTCDVTTDTCIGGLRCANYCETGKCVQCSQDSHCTTGTTGNAKKCDIALNECVECKTSADCNFDSSKSVCDASTKKCVQCTQTYQCAFEETCGSVCLNTTCTSGTDCVVLGLQCKNNEQCVECLSNEDCGKGTGKPQCDSSGICRQCIADRHCRSAENCDAECKLHKCVGGGLNCMLFPDTQRCHLEQGNCVTCYNDLDCSVYKDRPRCSFRLVLSIHN